MRQFVQSLRAFFLRPLFGLVNYPNGFNQATAKLDGCQGDGGQIILGREESSKAVIHLFHAFVSG